MANLDISVDDKLDEAISMLALKHYGDDSEASRKRVVEAALKMRIIWSHLIERGQQETGEAVSTWEFSESTTNRENNVSIQNWLFKR